MHLERSYPTLLAILALLLGTNKAVRFKYASSSFLETNHQNVGLHGWFEI